MTSSPHINFTSDDTLESKVDDYRKVSKAHRDIESSIKHAEKDSEWSQKLGTEQELEDAKKIIENSRVQAARAFSAEDLQEAKDKEILTQQETRQIASIKRQDEQREFRNEQQQSASNERSNTRSR